MKDRKQYHAERHARNPDAAKHRKEKERYGMKVAVFYAKLNVLRGRKIPDFVKPDLIEEALERAKEELSFQNVTTACAD